MVEGNGFFFRAKAIFALFGHLIHRKYHPAGEGGEPMLAALLLPAVPGVSNPTAPTGLGAPAGIVAPKHTSKDLNKGLNRNTTHSHSTHAAASASANSTVADLHGEPAPALSLAEQHTRMEEACLSSGTVSKLQNRLRLERTTRPWKTQHKASGHLKRLPAKTTAPPPQYMRKKTSALKA